MPLYLRAFTVGSGQTAVDYRSRRKVLLVKHRFKLRQCLLLYLSDSLVCQPDLQADFTERLLLSTGSQRKRNDPLPTMDDIKKPYGSSYRNMMAEVKDVFDNYGTMFPTLKGRKLELAGVCWFQGFNDQWGDAPGEYASNMKHFIKDVRKDLKAPKLPFTIAAIGTNGPMCCTTRSPGRCTPPGARISSSG